MLDFKTYTYQVRVKYSTYEKTLKINSIIHEKQKGKIIRLQGSDNVAGSNDHIAIR